MLAWPKTLSNRLQQDKPYRGSQQGKMGLSVVPEMLCTWPLHHASWAQLSGVAGRADKHGQKQERARAQGRDLDRGWRTDAHFIYLILLFGVHQAYGVTLSQGPIHDPEGYYHALQAIVRITPHLEQRPASPSCTPQASALHHSSDNSTVPNRTAAYTMQLSR